MLLADGEWHPTDLLVFDLDDDVFWPETPYDSPTMDWSDLPLIHDTIMEPQGNSSSTDKNSSQSTGNEGIIVNNYYSNQYQNSIDLSTAGGNAGDAQTGQGQLGNILGSAVNAFATAAPLLLDQNTEEMENLSDRVQKDTAGNTAVNTQSTVGCLYGYGASHKGDHPASCADIATDKVLAADRYYTFRLSPWTTSESPWDLIRVSLPHVLAGEDGGVFGSTLRRHYLFKCGWRVQVQCNASQFHEGSLLCFLAPEFRTNANFQMDTSWLHSTEYFLAGSMPGNNVVQRFILGMDHQNPWQWTLYPHQILNLRTNTSVDIEVPYVNVGPSSSWTQHSQWTLCICVLTPLQYVPGSASNIDITVSIKPVNPVFNGLRHEIVQPQAPLPVSVREHVGMWSSTLPDTAPPIYGKTPTAPHDYMPGEFTDLLELCQVPTFLGNTNTNVPYITATNNVTDTPLAVYQVTLACRCMTNTIIAAISRNFLHYRGSLTYTFMFTGTAMMKGKFLIAYTPPGAGLPRTRNQAMQSTYTIWDLGLNSSYNFTVPFISPTHFRLTTHNTPNIVNVDGWVTIWQLTPLTFPSNTPSTADIITMLSAGSDFTLKMPISPVPFSPQGVDNAEKGEVSQDDAAVDFVAEPVFLPENHTRVKFFYDRASPIGSFASSNELDSTGSWTYSGSDNRPNTCLLTPLPVWNGGTTDYQTSVVSNTQERTLVVLSSSAATPADWPAVTKQDVTFLSLSPFTYFKCDLEVNLSGPATSASPLDLLWVPAGAPKNTKQSLWRTPVVRKGRNPVLSLSGLSRGGQMTFTIPYNSPYSVLPAVWFNGFQNFDNTGPFGIAPAADFGTLYLQGPSRAYVISLRYKNMRTFCPRPTLYMKFPAVSTARLLSDCIINSPEYPIPILDTQMLSPVCYRLDTLITFSPSLIKFTLKMRNVSVRSFRIPANGLSVAGQLMVCMGMQPSVTLHNPRKQTYHVVFTTNKTQVSVEIYRGRQRPWKEPLRSEMCDCDIQTARDLILWVENYYRQFCQNRLMHDVETNPGPVMSVFQEQGAVLTKVPAPKDVLSNLVLGSLGVNNQDEFQQTLSIIQNLAQTWQTAKQTLHSPDFWTKLVLKTVKILSATLLYMHNPDTTTLLCLSLMSGIDIITEDSVFQFLKSKFSKVLSTVAPPIPSVPQSPFKNTNEGFTLAKNIEWATKLLKSIVNWLTSWFKQEEKTPRYKLEEMLVDFPIHANKICDLRCGKASYGDCQASFSYFEQLYQLAVTCQRIPLANLCEKFKNKHDHNFARVEPVCVVLRGKAGQGKSLAAQLIAQGVSKTMLGRQSVYSHPPDSDYMDGYENQYCVLMDDLAQNPDGEDFKVFCQMVSSTNFLPNMAHLERKGIPFTSSCIIATTNVPTFRPVTVAFTPAIERRITFDFTVSAGVDCMDEDGKLDMAVALQKLESKPKLPCFTKDCPLLHKRGLKFVDKRTGVALNLTEVVNQIIEKLNYKNACLNDFNTLVEQAPPKPEDYDHIITTLRQRQCCLEDELLELQEAFAQAQERTNLLSDWMKVSAIIFAALASLSAVVKIVTKLKDSISPAVKPVVLAENEQAAYSGKFLTQKTQLEVLDVQGPTKMFRDGDFVVASQSGNPIFDYEIYVAKNVVSPITFHYEDGGSSTQSCLLLKDRFLVTNRHVAETDWTHVTIKDVKHTRASVKCLSVNKQGNHVDLTFMKLAQGPLFKNNVSKFCSHGDSFPSMNETLTGIMNAGLPFVFEGKMLNANTSVGTTTGRSFNCVLQYRANTKRGWCGSAIIGSFNGRKLIYGLHSAGGAGVAAATIVSQELIGKAESAMENQMEPQGALTELEPGPRVHVPRKTKLRKTIAHGIFQPNFEPAVLSRYDSRTDKCVDDVAFSKHTVNVDKLPDIFPMVCKEYANRVFTLLGKDNGPLLVTEAILGIPGMDPMEKDTSPGLPYTQQGLRRTDLVDENGQMCNQLLQNYNKLRAGDYSGIIYQSFLKDEIRPTEKVKEAKTRIVDVPPFEHCILGRQLLGKFASKFQTNPGLDLGSAIGCDPDVHWTKFAYELLPYKFVYDVDYSNFDASHGTGMFECVIDNFFTESNGFSPELPSYLRSLAISTHAYEERRCQIEGGLPSGCAATSMLNTIFNNVIIRSALYMTYKNFEFDDVKILAYGDDLLVATNFQIDFNLVKQRLATINYKITPANKTTTFPLVSTLNDVTFLKRSFVMHNSYLFKPVMSEENLRAMVCYCRPGTLKDKLSSICLLAVHSGPDVYDELFQPFRKLGFVIPEYDTMLYRWLALFR